MDEASLELNNDLYHDDSYNIVGVIVPIDNKTPSVMIFGHNPKMTNYVDEIINNYINNIPTSGIVCLEFDTEEWSATTYFRSFSFLRG